MNRGHFQTDRDAAANMARGLRRLYAGTLSPRETAIVVQQAVDNYLASMRRVRRLLQELAS